MGSGRVLSPPYAIDEWDFNVRIFLLAVPLSTKSLCIHLTHHLTSKISRGVQQAVSADSVGQLQLKRINFLIQEKSAF